eukprot:2735813-Pleurochrysis_carterae.AAC.1
MPRCWCLRFANFERRKDGSKRRKDGNTGTYVARAVVGSGVCSLCVRILRACLPVRMQRVNLHANKRSDRRGRIDRVPMEPIRCARAAKARAPTCCGAPRACHRSSLSLATASWTKRICLRLEPNCTSISCRFAASMQPTEQ